MNEVSTQTSQQISAETVESVLIGGDLSKLKPAEKVAYYLKVCQSIGLNHLTKPFDYIKLNGKEVLYAKRDATDQLRKIHNISVEITSREQLGDVWVVTAKAKQPDGRTDESVGAVPTQGLKGDALANALMKTETKAKRRVTLSICGLGMLDETEIETIRDAKPADKVDEPDVGGPRYANYEMPIGSRKGTRFKDIPLDELLKSFQWMEETDEKKTKFYDLRRKIGAFLEDVKKLEIGNGSLFDEE